MWLILLLTGCVTLKDPEASQDYAGAVVATLEPGHRLGQTFVSRRANLNGITLWVTVLSDSPAGEGNLLVQLYHQPGEDTPLATVALPLGASGSSGPVEIGFPVQNDPGGQAYYLSLLSTSGRAQVLGRAEDGYAQGEASLDGADLPGDIAFRLSYEYGWKAGLGDLASSLRHAWLLFPLAGILLLPGWLIQFLASSPSQDGPPAGIAVTLGFSLAILPLLMAWTTAAGLSWNRVGWIALTGGMTAWVIWRLLKSRGAQPTTGFFGGYNLALLGITLGALAERLIMVRDLAAPPWVDSVHHSLITRIILERGAYPDTYLPYLDHVAAFYHPGFHSLLAGFLWLSGMNLPEGMLLFGQVLNASSVLAAYLLTHTLTGNRKAGLVAAMLTGFFSPMPAYYASWGRYTQLAGLLLLPTAYAWVRWLSSSGIGREATKPEWADWQLGQYLRKSWMWILLAGITCAGLVLLHYRVTVFFICLLIADFLTHGLAALLRRLKTPILSRLSLPGSGLGREVAALGLIAAASLLLLIPWLALIASRLISTGSASLTPSRGALFDGFAWSFLTTAQGKTTLYLAGAGWLLSLWKKPRFAISMVLWIALLFLAANLDALGILHSYINNLSVEIGLFLPITALGGFGIAQAIDWLRRPLPVRWHGAYTLSLIAVGVLASWWAARQLVTIMNPVTFLARRADWPALTWIQEHIPQDETILINPFGWGYGLYAGNDGGYWISPISGQRTLPPPVLYGFDADRNRIKRTNQLSQQVIDLNADPEALRTLLREEDIDYIYIGGRGGVLSPARLASHPGYAVLYHQDSTWVFQVK